MAVKISALAELPAGDVQDEDVLPIVDVSSSTTKKVSVEGIRSGVSLQRAYSAGTTVEISAANGPVRLKVADGEETALEIDGDLSVNGNVEIRASAGVAIGGDTAIVGDLSVTGNVLGANLVKHNFGAVTLPTASDDETKGYSVGSRWVVPGAGELVCLDATAGAAVWALAAEANPSPVVEPDGSVPMTGALTLQAISDPGAEAGAVRIYGKDVGGVTHLHAQIDDGTVHPITGPVAPEVNNTDTITVDGSNHGQVILCTSLTAITVTADQAPDGTTVSLIQWSSEQITVTAGSGVVLVHPATFVPKSAERYSKIVLYWLAPDIVHVSGHLEEA